jgi:hypothetical protein
VKQRLGIMLEQGLKIKRGGVWRGQHKDRARTTCSEKSFRKQFCANRPLLQFNEIDQYLFYEEAVVIGTVDGGGHALPDDLHKERGSDKGSSFI